MDLIIKNSKLTFEYNNFKNYLFYKNILLKFHISSKYCCKVCSFSHHYRCDSRIISLRFLKRKKEMENGNCFIQKKAQYYLTFTGAICPERLSCKEA